MGETLNVEEDKLVRRGIIVKYLASVGDIIIIDQFDAIQNRSYVEPDIDATHRHGRHPLIIIAA